MTVNIIIPVFNRLKDTKEIISNIRKQATTEKLIIYIVNDGSTDGTAEWLSKQKDIKVINGNGNLFWSGSIQKVLKKFLKNKSKKDWVLFINNDVQISKDYIESLLEIARKYSPAVVGSVVRNKKNKIVSLGPKISLWYLRVVDLIKDKEINKNNKIIFDVDALSGRGVLYPLKSLIDSKGLRPKILPHYFADYELSIRVKKMGYRLITSTKSSVYTNENFNLKRQIRKKEKIFFKIFSKKSTSLFYSKIYFWWKISNNIQRLTLLIRIILFIMFNGLRKKL